MTKTYLFYVSERPGPGRQRIWLPDKDGKADGPAYVRVVMARQPEPADALDEADFQAGEQFMNTHRLEVR